jgi:hypothetical protein
VRMPRDTHLDYDWGPTFKIAASFPKTGETAKLTAEELRRIQGGSPTLDPDRVIETARAQRSPIHGAFDWDDTEAAHQWRREQAKELQRSVLVYVVSVQSDGSEDRSQGLPLYASYTPPEGGRGYREVLVSAQDGEHRSALLLAAMRDLEKFRRRYATLSELELIFDEIDTLLRVEAPLPEGRRGRRGELRHGGSRSV